MGETKIEWATHTSNWLSGCTKVSPACQHCYAETMTARLASMPNAPARYRDGVIEGRRWTGRVAYDPDALRGAFNGLRDAARPRRVFANSMSDTFHAGAPRQSLIDLAAFIRQHEVLRRAMAAVRAGSATAVDAVNAGLMRCDGHVIMLLTKRPDRMLAWQREHFPDGLPSWVWVGCTVEDQKRADERVPVLLEVDAAVRFLSCEPLLGPINLSPQLPDGSWWQYLDNLDGSPGGGYGRGGRPGGGIGWVIAGGESGPKARPSHPAWFRVLRDQCAHAGVPFLFKQHGEWADAPRLVPEGGVPARIVGKDTDNPVWVQKIGKRTAGRLLDGVTHDAVPEVSDG